MGLRFRVLQGFVPATSPPQLGVKIISPAAGCAHAALLLSQRQPTFALQKGLWDHPFLTQVSDQ